MRVLLLCLVIELLGLGIIVPLLPFMALNLGASALDVTLLIATQSLALLLTVPFWGRASDIWGRRPVLLVSFFGTAVSFVILALADELWMLFVGRALAGLLSGEMAAGPAYIADVTSPQRRARAMGYLGATFAMGFVIGPFLGGVLAGGDVANADYRTPTLLAAGLAGTSVVLAFFFLRESRDPEAERRRRPPRSFKRFLVTLRFPYLPLVFSVLFLFGYVFASMESTLALWTEAQHGWGPLQVGYLLAFSGAVAVVVQAGLIGPLSRRYGETRLIVAAAVLLGIGMALVPLSGGVPLLLVALASFAAGFGLGNPALQSLVSRLSHADRTGGALGLSQSTTSLSRVLGPPVAGFLFEKLGRDAPYFAGGLVMILVVVLADNLRRRVARNPRLSQAD